MDDRQIKICDLLLSFFVQKKGQATDVEFKNELLKLGYENSEIIFITNLLIDDYGLLNRHYSRADLKRLTPKGFEVAKKGMKSFIYEKEKEEVLRVKSLSSSAHYPKWSIIISIIAIVITAIGIIGNNYQNRLIKRNYENVYNKNQIDSLLKIMKAVEMDTHKKTDSILIKK